MKADLNEDVVDVLEHRVDALDGGRVRVGAIKEKGTDGDEKEGRGSGEAREFVNPVRRVKRRLRPRDLPGLRSMSSEGRWPLPGLVGTASGESRALESRPLTLALRFCRRQKREVGPVEVVEVIEDEGWETTDSTGVGSRDRLVPSY
ncbi:hypothetical protein HK101_005384 [Irineochytrium annulatum]|nr:hypothetical protein HK101_005384 [Irineochytrium annulatum]